MNKDSDDLNNFFNNCYTPFNFHLLFSKKHPTFNIGQHDASEFLRILFDDLSKENNIVINKTKYKEFDLNNTNKTKLIEEYHKFYIERENSFIIDIYYTQLTNIFKCECGYISYSFEKILDIPLRIQSLDKNTDLKTLIQNAFSDIINNWSSICVKCNERNKKHYKEIKI